MYTKSSLRAGLFVVCASCSIFAHADELPDPLAPLPSETVRAARANTTAAATPAKTGTAKAGVAPATPAAASPATTTSALSTNAGPAAPAPAPTQPQTEVSPKPATPAAPAVAPTTTPTKLATEPAIAERPIFSQATIATFRQLDQLRSENALLAEQVKQKELREKLSNQVAIGSGNAALNGLPQTGASGSRGVQYFAICGVDNKLSANVALTNGSTAMVHEGSTIAGVGRVKSITIDQVTVVTKSGMTMTLEKAPAGMYSGGC